MFCVHAEDDLNLFLPNLLNHDGDINDADLIGIFNGTGETLLIECVTVMSVMYTDVSSSRIRKNMIMLFGNYCMTH